MTQQYLRQAQLVVGDPGGKGLDLSTFRFKFEINRGDIQTPNSCLIRVYNLSTDTIKKMQGKEFTQVLLQAGYAQNFGVIFQGSIKYIYTGHESAVDSYIDIVGADGDSFYNFAVVNTTRAAGSVASDAVSVVGTAAEIYGVTFDPSDLPPGFTQNPLPRGKVFYGMARDTLRQVAASNGMTWSIQDGKGQFVLLTSYKPGGIVKLTSATGMLGFPEQTQNGIRIRCLLNPSIKIGGRVQIDNASVQQFHFDLSVPGSVAASLVPKLDDDGIYKVLIAEHTGDTRGPPWYTDLTCIGVNASIPPGSPLINKISVAPYVGP